MESKALAVAMMSTIAFVFVYTLAFFIRTELAHAPIVLPRDTAATSSEPSVEDIALVSSSTTPLEATTFEKLRDDKGELVQVKRLRDGVTHEIRKEVATQRWTHASGTVLTLYKKDEFYNVYDARAYQFSLRVKRPGEEEKELYMYVPDKTFLFSQEITELSFSPLGTYVIFTVSEYEGSKNYTFATETAERIRPGATLESVHDLPYWNSDESRLVVLRSASPLDGTEAALFYSASGSFDDLLALSGEVNGVYQEHFISDAFVDGNTLTAKITSNEWEEGAIGTLVVDMQAGTYTAVPEIVW